MRTTQTSLPGLKGFQSGWLVRENGPPCPLPPGKGSPPGEGTPATASAALTAGHSPVRHGSTTSSPTRPPAPGVPPGGGGEGVGTHPMSLARPRRCSVGNVSHTPRQLGIDGNQFVAWIWEYRFLTVGPSWDPPPCPPPGGGGLGEPDAVIRIPVGVAPGPC